MQKWLVLVKSNEKAFEPLRGAFRGLTKYSATAALRAGIEPADEA